MANMKLFFFQWARGSPIDLLTRKEMYPLVNITERFLLYLWLDNEKSLILNEVHNISYLRAQIKGIERCQSWRVSPMLACLFLFLSAVSLYFCRLFVCISVDCLFIFLSAVCLVFCWANTLFDMRSLLGWLMPYWEREFSSDWLWIGEFPSFKPTLQGIGENRGKQILKNGTSKEGGRISVAELGSLSSGAKMAMKIFVNYKIWICDKIAYAQSKNFVRVQTFRRGRPCPRTTSATLGRIWKNILVWSAIVNVITNNDVNQLRAGDECLSKTDDCIIPTLSWSIGSTTLP